MEATKASNREIYRKRKKGRGILLRDRGREDYENLLFLLKQVKNRLGKIYEGEMPVKKSNVTEEKMGADRAFGNL